MYVCIYFNVHVLQGTDAGITNEIVELIMFVQAYHPREANVINVCQWNNETGRTSYANCLTVSLAIRRKLYCSPDSKCHCISCALFLSQRQAKFCQLSNTECNDKNGSVERNTCSSTVFASYYYYY